MFFLIGLYVLSAVASIAIWPVWRTANRRGLNVVRAALTWDERPRMDASPVEACNLCWPVAGMVLLGSDSVLTACAAMWPDSATFGASVIIGLLMIGSFGWLYAEFRSADAERRQRWTVYCHPVNPDVARSSH